MVQTSHAAESQIGQFYFALRRTFGQQHWWPAKTPFEVIVGAYLTQNTSWTNVELAMRRLRSESALSVSGIRRVSLEELQQRIRPAGYFRQKALALKSFVEFLDANFDGSLVRMFALPTDKLREQLLELRGVGPETADSILLYAGQHPSFVVDAYTRRIFERHGLISPQARYGDIKTLCEAGLKSGVDSPSPSKDLSLLASFAHPPSRMSKVKRTGLVQVYNDMHGLIVSTGKQFCLKSKPLCEQCPLSAFLPSGGPILPVKDRSARPVSSARDGSKRGSGCI